MCTRRSRRANWGEPVNLGPVVNSPSDERGAFLSADGRTLLFSSNRSGGHGAHDIYMCTRSSMTAPWSKPVNLGPTINTLADEGSPSMSRDGRLLVFHSSREGGAGGYDVYFAARRSTADSWQEPVNLRELNSTSIDMHPFLNADGTELYFSSSRPGGRGGRDLWMCRVSIK